MQYLCASCNDTDSGAVFIAVSCQIDGHLMIYAVCQPCAVDVVPMVERMRDYAENWHEDDDEDI